MSWWIGVFFTVGCALFILTGLLKVLPVAAPGTFGRPDSGKEMVGGIAACIGATLFAFAGVLLIFEATNPNRARLFGKAIEQTYDQAISGDDGAESPNKAHSDGEDESLRVQHLTPDNESGARSRRPEAGRTWEWWPTKHEFTSHYTQQTGFVGSMILAIGTIIFLISGILSLPPLTQRFSPTAMKWTYWLAFFVGGLHFAAASILYLLKSQTKWYRPTLRSLGWWVGFWDLVGSVGWTLSASFGGYCSKDWCEWQSDVSLLWASIAFFIGSSVLWYKAVEKYPLERVE